MNIDKLLEHQKKLSHLSRSEVDMLLKRYGDGDKCSVLIDEYKIDITASQLSKTFPFVIAADERCPNCNTDMLRKYPTKSDIQYNYGRKKEAFCRTCEHRVQAYGRACNCQKCKDVKLLEVLKKQNAEKESRLNRMEIIFEEYKNNITHFDINEYSIKERLYISALLRATLDETMLEIGPISKYLDNFAPTAEYKNKIIYQLKESSKILFSPHSPPESIIEINDGISKYYPFRSMYRINAMLDEYKESIESLISVNDIIDKVDIETKKEPWMEIGLYECLG